MNLSKEQLDDILSYAQALTPIEDVALLMGLDEDELRDEVEMKTPIGITYLRGIAYTQYELRKVEINLAGDGSPMAIQNVKGYIERLICNNDI